MTLGKIGAAVLALSLMVGACGGATPSPADTAAALASTAPTATPTSVPTPTPEPVDVAALFADQVGSFNSGIFAFDGSATVGPVQLLMSGTLETQGPDSHSTITTTLAGVDTTVETVLVAGRFYQKVADGPWLEAPPAAGDGMVASLRGAARAAFRDEGTEVRDDQVVHRLVSSGGSAFDPGVLLASATGVSNASGQFVFFAIEDGTPVGAEVEARWTQTEGDATLDASMTFSFRFSQLGVRQTIRVPAPVWISFSSGRWDYAFAYPGDFDYSKGKKYDSFVGPSDNVIVITRLNRQGFTLNEIAKAELTELKRQLSAKQGTNEPLTLGTVKARLLTVTGKSKDLGGKYTAYYVVVVRGGYFYNIAWLAPVAQAEDDLVAFRQALAAFEFSE